MLRIPHCLDNRLRDGGEVVSLKRLPRFTIHKDVLVLVSVTGCEINRAMLRLEGLGKLKNFNDLNGKRASAPGLYSYAGGFHVTFYCVCVQM
jgi:hypothetical protein